MPEKTEEKAGTAFDTSMSETMSEQMSQVIPGGVDSPFRSFVEVGGHTIFFNKASGSRLYDVDGNEYIDYLGAWGPAILGHCPREVVEACQKVMAAGPVFGAPHALELALAKELIAAVASLEKVRFVNSGTEAVMSAVRLARGYTGRNLIVMFEGCYHGHSDSVLSSTSHRASAGIPAAVAQNTLLVPYNDAAALERCLEANCNLVAAVVVEPVAGSMGVIPPEPGFLKEIRRLCTDHDALLIFDEVLTGFRVALGGAQALFDVTPDLTCFGKALGGGMPIGAYGGRAGIMDRLQPTGDVYQAGTFSGNPVTMAGGIETLRLLRRPQVYETLEKRTARLFEGLSEIIQDRNLPIQLQRVGSMFGILFSSKPVKNYEDSLRIDGQAFARFFRYLLIHGVYLPPSAVDAACVSAAHTEEDIERTISVCADALSAVM
ncbi:MAG TPA: glutamate-1-semialdehyde 2,1-aminomutase [Candidatus Obscuribacterales bacterium]